MIRPTTLSTILGVIGLPAVVTVINTSVMSVFRLYRDLPLSVLPASCACVVVYIVWFSTHAGYQRRIYTNGHLNCADEKDNRAPTPVISHHARLLLRYMNSRGGKPRERWERDIIFETVSAIGGTAEYRHRFWSATS